MTEEAAARIFDSFTQADEDTHRRYGGTGLGTAIAKELVEQMAGAIGVESRPGHGSRFWFSLAFGLGIETRERTPAATVRESSKISTCVSAGDGSAPTKGRRILVVEDNPANRRVAAKTLELAGYHVDVADSGPSALVNVACESYDLLLLDMELPGFGGLELLARLRSQFGDEVRAVVLTANATEEAKDACLAAGADGFLTKPISGATFLSTIQSAFAKRPFKGSPVRLPGLVSVSRLKEQLALDRSLEFVVELVDLWREDADRSMHQLCESVRNCDVDQTRRHLHALEGGASELGANGLIESCQRLRASVLNDDCARWNEAMTHLQRTYQSTCAVFDGLTSVAKTCELDPEVR
jgi:two-component system sensor histidine kinase RpfC